MQKYTVAVVQAAPKLFDIDATLDMTEKWVEKASAQGAKLILFPEAYIPAYPRGLSFGTVVGSRSPKGRDLWLKYWENALEVSSEHCSRLGKMAKKAKAYLAIGVIEREAIGGSLYCTLLYFGPDGSLLGKHRKLKPTAAERILWGEGDGSTLTSLDTDIGKIGGLICWENYMPLARMAMYRQGVEVYLAPTADHRDTWQATVQHIACEGRCYVLSCNQFVTKEMYPEELRNTEEGKQLPEIITRGGSTIISPLGEVMAGPLFGEEGILFADIDLRAVAKSKMDFDVVGHYARPDVFQLQVPHQPEPIRVHEKV